MAGICWQRQRMSAPRRILELSQAGGPGDQIVLLSRDGGTVLRLCIAPALKAPLRDSAINLQDDRK